MTGNSVDKLCEFARLFGQLPADKQALMLALLRLPEREQVKALRVLNGERSIPEGMTPVIVTERAQFWFVNDDLVDDKCAQGDCLSLAPLAGRINRDAPPLYTYQTLGDDAAE